MVLIGVAANHPLTLSAREQSLLKENEELRAELLALRARITPTMHRWARLKLTPTSALVLDMLWDSTHPISIEQMFFRINMHHVKQSKRVLGDRKCINVFIFRLRKGLETVAKMQPIDCIAGHGYVLKNGSRPILEKWLI